MVVFEMFLREEVEVLKSTEGEVLCEPAQIVEMILLLFPVATRTDSKEPGVKVELRTKLLEGGDVRIIVVAQKTDTMELFE